MAKREPKNGDGGTGPAAGSAAGRVLRNPNSSKDDKSAAGSDLAQVPDKPEKGKTDRPKGKTDRPKGKK